MFGGGAGGGKTYLGCIWLTKSAITYPESRWFLSREVNKDIRESSLLTLLNVMGQSFGLKVGIDYKYNPIDSRIVLSNGSMIFLKELPYIPSDPECDYLGSMEYTGGFIDEAQEVNRKVKNTIKTRIRYGLKEFKLVPKLLMTCNPGKGFLYDDFYAPSAKGEPLKNGRYFLRSLVTDNPRVSREYIKSLEELDDESMKQRLLYGNWDFTNDVNQLVPYQWISNSITPLLPSSELVIKKSLGVDIANEGDDKTIISEWWHTTDYKILVDSILIDVPITDQSDISGLIGQKIIDYCMSRGIGYQDVIVDAVGVGVGVRDNLRGRGWYVNSYKGGESVGESGGVMQYKNLRSYSYWQFREGLQSGKIKIYEKFPRLSQLSREATAHTYKTDDKVIVLEKKDNIKKKIGNSPDTMDSAVMGYAPQPTTKFAFVM